MKFETGSAICLCLMLFDLSGQLVHSQDQPGPVDQINQTVLTDVYVVEGKSSADLLRELNNKGPSPHFARTDWKIGWSFSVRSTSEGVELKEFKTHVEIRYTLPEWDAPEGTRQAILTEWERFMKALRVHEAGHAQLAIDAAKQMERVCRTKGYQSENSRELSKLIDLECKAILDRYLEKEVQYDKETRHGRTQGAWLRRR